MNARVLLLMLVTAGFMAAWDGDQAVMQAAIAKRNEQRREAIAAMSIDADTAVPSDGQAAPSDVKTVSVTHPKAADTQAAQVPLPKGIAAGTYQAVNQAGTSIRVDVEEPTDAPSRDFYMVDAEDGNRWYLIRVTR